MRALNDVGSDSDVGSAAKSSCRPNVSFALALTRFKFKFKIPIRIEVDKSFHWPIVMSDKMRWLIVCTHHDDSDGSSRGSPGSSHITDLTLTAFAYRFSSGIKMRALPPSLTTPAQHSPLLLFLSLYLFLFLSLCKACPHSFSYEMSQSVDRRIALPLPLLCFCCCFSFSFACREINEPFHSVPPNTHTHGPQPTTIKVASPNWIVIVCVCV